MGTTLYTKYSNNAIMINHLTKIGEDANIGLPHAHDLFEMILFKRGRVTYRIGGASFELSPNDLIITRPNDVHAVDIDPTVEYERYNILLDASVFPFELSEKLPHSIHVISMDNNKTVKELFKKMDVYVQSLEGDELKAVMQSIVCEAVVNLLLECKGQSPAESRKLGATAQKAIDYIEQRLFSDLSVEGICAELFVTKSHLHHVFKNELGTTPKKYITEKRLALARREINAGEKPTEVYIKLGFPDYSTFFRAYKKHFGVTPSSRVYSSRKIITYENTTFISGKETKI
jgi:AraC-like DNA-binding protein